MILLPGPRGSRVDYLAASRGRLLFQLSWGNGHEGTLRAALFLYVNGVTRALRDKLNPYGGGSAVWSPDGSRIALFENGDLETIAPEGGNPVRLTTSPGLPKGENILWSPDGSALAFWAHQRGLDDVYVVPARGGPVRRVTNSSRVRGSVDRTGTAPLAWLGNRVLGVVRNNSLSVVWVSSGKVTAVCTMPNTMFGNATPLR